MAVRTKEKPAPSALVRSIPEKIGNDVAELLFLELEAIRAKTKGLYAEADAIEGRLIEVIGPTGSITTGDGRKIVVRNNFYAADGTLKNLQWKASGFKMLEVVAE